jgi:prepilin-type N-terminal cleavage/methylation domain-containing protein
MVRRRGFTIGELLISMSIFGLVMAVSAAALIESNRIFLNSSGRDSAVHELAKAHAALEADLEMSRVSSATFKQSTVPAHQGSGLDGDAIDFLSPDTSPTSQAVYGTDGTAFWMRNIVYYLIVPQNHDALNNHVCAGVADAYGYDDGCPHKILMRQISDQNTSDPTNPTTEQSLLSPFPTFARPIGYPKTSSLTTVAIHLLTFRCTLPHPGQIQIDLRALSFDDASKSVSIGSTPLSQTPFVIEQTFSVFPRN